MAGIPLNSGNKVYAVIRKALLAWENPFVAAALTAEICLIYVPTVIYPWLNSNFPYFNYLADAFLHGQLHLRLIPPITQGLSLFQGSYYLYWGPLPAILALPFVAIFGIQASDILQSIAAGALNVGLFALLLRVLAERGFVVLSPARRAAFVLFFAFGTAQAPIMLFGGVWDLSQLETMSMVLLAYLATFAFRGPRAFWWTGCAVAGILLTRLGAAFAALFLAWYLLRTHWQLGLRQLARLCLLALAPVLTVFFLLGVYNYLRFGSPLDNGVAYHVMHEKFIALASQYGIFNLHYVPTNLYLNYLYYPLANFFSGRPSTVALGGSLFLLSPLFLAAPFALWREPRRVDQWVLCGAFLLGNIPALIIMAPGSEQFGPRYLLDAAVPLLLLTARGMKRWPAALIAVLTGLSVLQYILGIFGF